MWVARNENGGLYLWNNKPIRHNADRNDYPEDYPENYPIVGSWASGFDIAEEGACGAIPNELFPELKWEDEPLEVSIEAVKDLKQDYHDSVKYQAKDIKIRDILHEMASRKEELGLTDDIKSYLKRLTDIVYDRVGKDAE